MTIPVYRHNLAHDDWEIASVYGSDDCGSLGGSAYDESLHSSNSLDNPALRSQGYPYGDARPRFANGYPVPQQQRQNYTPAPHPSTRWDALYAPGKSSSQPSSYIIPPPGVIFPSKDWTLSSQDTYWLPSTNQIASSSNMPMDAGLVETPPPPPLLLSPSSPPPAPSPLKKRPSPGAMIAHGQAPHAMPVVAPGTGTGANTNAPHASPMMPPPPRYYEVAHAVPPRLADAGCQAHSSTAISPPRRSGHDVLSSYAPGSGHGSMPRGPRSSEEFTLVEGRGGPGGQPVHGPGDRPDAHPPPVPSKYEHEHEHDGGRARTARPQMRERRPSIWQRFVRRFSPSHVSVGHT